VKANREKTSLANAGLGVVSHLYGMMFMSAIQIKLLTVPYKGTASAMNDLMGRQVGLLCDQTTQTLKQIQGGTVKAYGVTTKARIASLPNLPTLAESGLPGFEVVVWQGIFAPKGTPKPVIDRLAQSVQAALKDPDVRKRLADLGAEITPVEKQTPEALRGWLKAEIDKWVPVIRKAGVYAD
ncbi:MAG: tripartite tricarboxylate transporter substrate-binding protein, partial [Burkholderiales bacterium]